MMSWETPSFVTLCPPGEARWSHYLRTDGRIMANDLTCRPKQSNARLVHGQGIPQWSIKGRRTVTHLWNAELIVFLKEMTPYVRAQLLLEKMEEQAKQDREEGRDPISGRLLIPKQKPQHTCDDEPIFACKLCKSLKQIKLSNPKRRIQMQTRRQFGKYLGTGALAASIGEVTMGLSCSSIFSNIANYVPVGLQAFDSVVSLLDPTLASVLAPVIKDIKSGFADVTLAVTNYQNAPAADKTTLKGKISTALSVVSQLIQQFWNDANLPDGGLATTIFGVLQIILSTMASFMPQLPAVSLMSSITLTKTIPIDLSKAAPSPKKLKSSINDVFAANGYAAKKLY